MKRKKPGKNKTFSIQGLKNRGRPEGAKKKNAPRCQECGREKEAELECFGGGGRLKTKSTTTLPTLDLHKELKGKATWGEAQTGQAGGQDENKMPLETLKQGGTGVYEDLGKELRGQGGENEKETNSELPMGPHVQDAEKIEKTT